MPIDLADPNRKEERELFLKQKEELGHLPIPPLVFNDDERIGVSTGRESRYFKHGCQMNAFVNSLSSASILLISFNFNPSMDK